ncbi:MAG: PEP-CTERM sorting domain-containing protein [Pirellulaceae bacterium]
MRKLNWVAAFAAVGMLGIQAAQADVFFPVESVTVTYPDGAGGALWPESNLIQGPGIGFDADEPHDKILDGDVGNWVTDACGFPCDYIESFGSPIIELDLGTDRLLSEISTWGYSDSNTNGMADFTLRFATAAEGPGGYGTSITYNPEFVVEDYFEYDAFERRSFAFDQDVTARYIELVPTRNYFDDPGDGTGENGWGPGGDRVGIGEIAFQAPDDFVPEPPDGNQVEFYEIDDIISSTEFTDLYPAENLIQGPGLGFLAVEPHSVTSTGQAGSWVTEACGFPCDYLDTFDAPELVLDLGADVDLNEINVWGYAATNANGVLEFELEFATEADGDTGFGSSISYNPTFSDVELDPTIRQQFAFDETVTARYVLLRALDNYFEEPGDGSGELGRPAGGDRIGLSEIAFPIPGTGGGVPGDFNGNGMLDAEDIDGLTIASAAGSTDALFDLNDDGNVNSGDVTVWIKDLYNSWIGDSNLDGEFSSRDFVAVFTAGKFEQDVDATWGEGDWNGDGRFNSSDFVAAFTDGGFELGPRGAVSAVPEPASATLLAFAGLALLGMARRRN